MSEKSPGSGQPVRLHEPTPWPDAVDGSELLSDLSGWISEYILLPEGAADALAVWAIATWLVDGLYFAPLLTVTSPTKRCGKSNLLHLLRWIVYRGHLTSGVGVTPAVVFRFNEREQPTLLIDEAEKLRSQAGGNEIISLLNAGYRSGQTVQRCVGSDGDYAVRTYNAFGFRVIALIGTPWDTLVDRSITIPMQRKPRSHQVGWFNGREIDRRGQLLAQEIARWVKDNRTAILEAENTSPRPEWLNDRECDNWSVLFAIAEVAAERWPERVAWSAQLFRAKPGEDGDRGERLIQDVRAVFESRGNPESLKSGDLVGALNKMETSPWGGLRGGHGLTTHGLASRLRPFEVAPRQHRTLSGEKIRGYWLGDLQPVFDRYPPVAELGQVGQASEDGPHDCPTSVPVADHQEGRERDNTNPRQKRDVPLVPLPLPDAPR